jgi:hypothetical protein
MLDGWRRRGEGAACGVWGIRRETLRTADDARPSCSWGPGSAACC